MEERRGFVKQAVGELELRLADALLQVDEDEAQVVRVARAYLADPWDAIPDDLPNGLDDDLFVLAHAACTVGIGISAAVRRAACKIGEREPNLVMRVARLLSKGANLEAAFTALRGDATGIALEVGWSERDVDGAAVAPPAPPTTALTVTAYGRTSCGKTTLVSRLIREIAPGAVDVAKLLRTSPNAHTTRAPLVIDFDPGASSLALAWGGPAGAGRHIEPAESVSGTWIPAEAAWSHVVIPRALRRLRLLDLPGTHGNDAGAWSFSAQHGLLSADVVLLPMDRRQFREEEIETLREALRVEPERHIALALRRGPQVGGDAFVQRRILAHDFGHQEIERIEAMPTFEIARRDDWQDEAGLLVTWLDGLSTHVGKRTFETLRTTAELDRSSEPATRALRARELMLVIGLMRACRAVMLHGGGHDGK